MLFINVLFEYFEKYAKIDFKRLRYYLISCKP